MLRCDACLSCMPELHDAVVSCRQWQAAAKSNLVITLRQLEAMSAHHLLEESGVETIQLCAQTGVLLLQGRKLRPAHESKRWQPSLLLSLCHCE